MAPFYISVCIMIGTLFYTFTCVLAYKFMDKVLRWHDAADSPLVVVWPAILLFFIFFGWPFMGMLWIVNKMPKHVMRLAKKTKRSYSEVK